MKKFILALALVAGISMTSRAESTLTAQSVVLTPYVISDDSSPLSRRLLQDKLEQIVLKYGVGANNGIPSPFIITANVIELSQEQTATVPPRIALELSMTLYIGNGEEGIQFASCNMNLRGVGQTYDRAYASAIKHLNINAPELKQAIDEGKRRIENYYQAQSELLIQKARTFAEAGDYAEAYAILLRVPPICSRYDEAQELILSLVRQEKHEANAEILARARAAWSASPDRRGAGQARAILDEISNADPELKADEEKLLKEMAAQIKTSDADERAAREKREQRESTERREAIRAAQKAAEAYAKRPVYNLGWW